MIKKIKRSFPPGGLDIMSFYFEDGEQIPQAPRKKKKALLEKDVEAYLVKRVKELGGRAEKFTSPSRRSVPDRLVSWPASYPRPATIVFVECKAPGKKPTKAQAEDHKRRREMGFLVYVVDSYESVDEIYPPRVSKTRRRVRD